MLDEPQSKDRLLFNPTFEDVTVDIDKYGPHHEEYTLKAGTVDRFPTYVADILEERLVDKMLWKSIPKNKNREKRRLEILEQIRV